MKKRHLKQWVVNTLIIINFIAIMFMGADCDNMALFISSKLIALLIFAFNNYLLFKHRNLFEEESNMSKVETFEDKMKQINKIPIWIKQHRQINTLENKIEALENSIKEELYKEFMKKLGEPMEAERFRKENKMLRQKIKVLKEMIKEGK